MSRFVSCSLTRRLSTRTKSVRTVDEPGRDETRSSDPQCLRFWYSSHWLSHNASGHQSTNSIATANNDYVNERKTNCVNWISDKQPDQFIKEWLSNSPQLRMHNVTDRLISERAPCEKSCLSCDSVQWCFSDWTKQSIHSFCVCRSNLVKENSEAQ